jgi:hypothetical protein
MKKGTSSQELVVEDIVKTDILIQLQLAHSLTTVCQIKTQQT